MALHLYHLDTSTIVLFLRGRSSAIRDRLQSLLPEQVAISQIVRAELLVGCLKSLRPETHRERLDQFLARLTIVDFKTAEAEHYAEIRTALELEGKGIGPNDLLIAATARAARAILVTSNESEFRRVPRLKVENWA
ncbi:type II toxin-antitoxin system VapC family toxin [soil metagenome]